jgi:hypothetical protein
MIFQFKLAGEKAMTKQKPRIAIKDLPRNMLISDDEIKKIAGGAWLPPGYVNAYFPPSPPRCPTYLNCIPRLRF